MTNVTIMTIPHDLHSRAVEWVLTRRPGVTVDYLLMTDFPAILKTGISLSSSLNEDFRITKRNTEITFGTMWRRRHSSPSLPKDVHPSDQAIGKIELQSYVDGFHQMLDARMHFCANTRNGQLKSMNKINQLKAAADAKLRIPDTLISNSHSEIHNFFLRNNGNVIMKSFTSPTWESSESLYVSFTKLIDGTILAQKESIELIPAIYQRAIEKKKEVRAIFMGDTYFAIEIYSQSDERSSTDWRAAPLGVLPMAAAKLPADIVEKCRALMRSLDIVMGSFDLIIDEDDNYVFLEVNEQGQFLWLEAQCLELPCLQAFCDFLESQDEHFNWNDIVNKDETLKSFDDSGSYQQSCIEEKSVNHVQFTRMPYAET